MNHSTLFRMKRSVKIGTFAFVAGVILLAALIVVNLVVGALPVKFTKFDASGRGLTEISDETKKLVSGLTEDVTIYWLSSDGSMDAQTSLLLSRYEETGKHITVQVVDPTKDKAFAEKYQTESLSDYSFIVESARRVTVIDNTDTFLWTNYAFQAAYQLYSQYLPADIIEPMSAAELQSALSQYGSMVTYMFSLQGATLDDISQYNTVTAYCAEARLTAALDYVTREYIPHPYLLEGFGDGKPSDSLATLLYSLGMDLELLDLSKSSIPVDANCLVLFNPSRDLTAEEAAVIIDYLNAGGSLMLSTSPEVVESCPNLASVTALFGLIPAPGLVQEGDTSYISGNQYTLVPTVTTKHSSAYYISSSGYKPQLPNAHAITVAETLPEGVTVTPLFTTSDKAVRVSLDKEQTLNEAGNLEVAVAATKSITTSEGTTKTACITWFASAEALTDTVAEANSGGNYYYYAATMSVMGEIFSSPYEELAPVSLQTEFLEENKPAMVAGLLVGVILVPSALLATGIVIWSRRKKR